MEMGKSYPWAATVNVYATTDRFVQAARRKTRRPAPAFSGCLPTLNPGSHMQHRRSDPAVNFHTPGFPPPPAWPRKAAWMIFQARFVQKSGCGISA